MAKKKLTNASGIPRKTMKDEQRKSTVSNIVGAMSGISGDKKTEIINR